MDDVLVWQDIFDLFKEQVNVIEGKFKGNDDQEYYFKGRWHDGEGKWVVKFWII